MDTEEQTRRKILIAIACTMTLITYYYYKYIYEEPCTTSIPTGEMWIKKVLKGNPTRCVKAFRMKPQLFLRLCKDLTSKYGLKANSDMSVHEKVGIFLYALAQGVSLKSIGKRFQRSEETISSTIKDVLNSISSRKVRHCLERDVIRPYDRDFKRVSAKISRDKRYMPFFKDCVGCISGTHIAARIPEALQMPYIGRHGVPTFRVLATCDFDMCFTFFSVGWEGSAHDTRVFLHAIETSNVKFPMPPEGKYYLADKGYPDRSGFLVPYSNCISRFQNTTPQNGQETFNHWHSSLQSCIERSFGVLKQNWKMLTKMPKFSIETQIHIIVATFALHNYIRINSPDDPLFRVLDEYPDSTSSLELRNIHACPQDEVVTDSCTQMKVIRDRIANSLWEARHGS